MITELIGREAELADLLARLDDAVHGAPHLVICSGEAGVGKTRLVAELAGRARERGVRTLWARALELPDTPPFWLWRQALGTGTPVPGADRIALFEGFAAGLDGTDTGVLLVIDDIHWADEPSLQALLYVVRALRERRIMVCATERTGATDGGWPAIKPELVMSKASPASSSGSSRPASSRRQRAESAGESPRNSSDAVTGSRNYSSGWCCINVRRWRSRRCIPMRSRRIRPHWPGTGPTRRWPGRTSPPSAGRGARRRWPCVSWPSRRRCGCTGWP
ncbi:ATP-binding protein [Nocardia sp. No.11]|uniref:ATP-binding protein n=1 Tax=Nocardia sp. No.11 TaxID=3128861 RepID=UPI00319E820F